LSASARVFVLVLLAVSAGAAAAQDLRPPHGVAGTNAGPRVTVRAVGLGEGRWTDGFWKQRFDVCRTATVPHLWRVMRGTEYSQYLENFRIAAGLSEGRHRGAAFNDGDFYKWLEAAVVVNAAAPEPNLAAAIDESVRAIRTAQRPDGYLHTRIQLRQKQGDANARPFRDPLQFEAYCLGHLMTAACVHHRLSGRNDLLDCARKAADFLDTASVNPTPEFARCAICPSHYMGLVELHRTTRERRYLELAKRLLSLRDTIKDGTDDNQDRVPFREQRKAHGHAVRANYLYAGAADLYAETGDRTLLAPLTAVWDDLVATKLAITGGCGALYDGASPDGSKEQRQIGRVHQAYGRDYQLPQSTAHNETCAAVGLALWSWRMLQITGEAKYADVLEQVLHNAVLAGVSLNGTNFFYTNTLRQLDRMPAELRWSRTRQPYFGSFCCPPNVARLVAESSNYVYGVADKAVWVHQYGASELATDVPGIGRVKLTQETDYPWDGRVRLTVGVERPATFEVRVRIPGWTRGAAVAVNGAAIDEPIKSGSYLVVRREWRAGDSIALTLPMPARVVEAHPLVEEARNQVAVMRGPLVYCLESTDLPAGVSVLDVALPVGAELRPRFDARLLGGVAVLEGRGEQRTGAAWGRELYRDVALAAPKPIDLRLVPYFAWANRGRSEMSVWLPVGR
jgi:DUF1680 family protein